MTEYSTPSHFDELDYAIMHTLSVNARSGASEVARVIGANERTVRKRIDDLIAAGTIRPVMIVDARAFGYVTAVDVLLKVEAEYEEEVVEKLSNMPEIVYIAYGYGSHDISIQAHFRDNIEVRAYLRHILPSLPGVTVTGSILVTRILRNIVDWTPRIEDFAFNSNLTTNHNEINPKCYK